MSDKEEDDKTIGGLSRKFAMLKALKEHHERILKVINTDLGITGKELYDCFADEEVAQIRVPGKFFKDTQERIVKPDLVFKGTVPKEKQPLFFTYMRANKFGDLIKESIHHKTLSKWITARKKANAELPSEDLLKVFTIETATSKRAPKRAENGSEEPEPEEPEPAEEEEGDENDE